MSRLAPFVAALALGAAALLGSVPPALSQSTPDPDLVIAAQPASTFAPTFTVSGLVAGTRRVTLDDLQALPQVTLPVTFGAGQGIDTGVFTGPRLLDVLDAAGGPTFPTAKNGKLRTYVLATGADGYQAIVAWGELDPAFGADPVLVAWERDGNALGDGQGMARLVVPQDKAGGRHVATLSRLELRDGGGAPAK